jgi:dTDP-4-amino-4,6-dideoxygalactose transaminase
MTVMKRIKLFDQSIDQKEFSAVKKTLESHFWASGSSSGNVGIFENSLKKYLKTKSCVSVNSGTAALHLALSAFDIKNKEVLLPSLSFVSTAHAIIYNGGIPKFIDINPETMCIDENLLENKITKKTKMILPVHFAGIACNMDKIKKICKKNNLFLIEDAAHAMGTSYNNKKIGTHGDLVCFSFHPTKNLPTPSGGAISINSKNYKKLTEKLLSRRWCGISKRKESTYDIEEIGWNYYMNQFSAAIGNEQLKKLDIQTKKRIKIAKRYSEELIVESKMKYDENCAYHFYWICVKNRKNLMKKLNDNGIETGIHYPPIHKMGFYKKSKVSLPVTELMTKCIISLPCHPNLKENEISFIIKNLNQFTK